MILDAISSRSSFNMIHLETMLKVDVFVLKSRHLPGLRFHVGEHGLSRVPAIAREVNTMLQRAFTLWMLHILDKQFPEDLEGFDLGALDELEAKHMLEKTIEEYKKKVQEEAREEGRKATADTVLLLLETKFGDLPAAVRARVESMSLVELKELSHQVRTTQGLSDLGLGTEQPR